LSIRPTSKVANFMYYIGTVWEGTCDGVLLTCVDHVNRAVTNGIYGDMTTSGTMKWNIGYDNK
jgi:hypothetical protein